jgi:VanZ family protein
MMRIDNQPKQDQTLQNNTTALISTRYNHRKIPPMRFLAFLAIVAFFSVNALVSAHKEWFDFIYSLPGEDKLAHFIVTGLLSFFMVLGFSSLTKHSRPRAPIVCMAAASLLATLDEAIQLVMPSRTFDLRDLAWSLAGVLVFGIAAMAIQRIRLPRDVT